MNIAIKINNIAWGLLSLVALFVIVLNFTNPESFNGQWFVRVVMAIAIIGAFMLCRWLVNMVIRSMFGGATK